MQSRHVKILKNKENTSINLKRRGIIYFETQLVQVNEYSLYSNRAKPLVHLQLKRYPFPIHTLRRTEKYFYQPEKKESYIYIEFLFILQYFNIGEPHDLTSHLSC